MRTFNYSKIKEQKWDSELLGYIAAIYKEAGKQEMYLKQRPEELEKLVEIAKIQSTEASNAIEGIVTTNTRIRQLVEGKTTPRNRCEQEIAGYRDVLGIIHESFDAIPITRNYILQLHKILYSHMNNPVAGRTKIVQNYITATYPDGHSETLFIPLPPHETPEALDRICEEYNRVIEV
jgi:Fic family protein